MEWKFDESTIGETPLIALDMPDFQPSKILAKVEWFNFYRASHGGGSIKTRIAQSMLDAAESDGDLTGDRTIIEPSSGNTGSEIARIGRNRGYNVEIVMPDNASGGKIDAITEVGAKIHFVDANLGYDAVIERCEEIVRDSPETYYRPNQYTNPFNTIAHENTTAREIWSQTGGSVTHFVSGVGTGGTVTGTGRGLTERGNVTIVGFEPAEPLHAIDGLKYLRTGNHYHPETYDESILDLKEYVRTEDAYFQARKLQKDYADGDIEIVDPGQYDTDLVLRNLRVKNDFLVGTSSGAAVQAVKQMSEKGVLEEDSVVVIIFADRGDKYADIPLWEAHLS